MTEVSVKITSSLDTKKWSDFVYNHPHGNIFQTPEMAEVYKRTKNYEPISLAVVDDTDEIQAVMLAVVIKEMKGILGSFTARSIVQGGPLFSEGDLGFKATLHLLQKYEEIARKKAIYSEIRMLHKVPILDGILKNSGFVFEDHFNALIDISKPKEELWEQLKKDRKRGIKKARKAGIIIEECNKREEIKIFYDLVKETYKRAGIPLADISLFESVFDVLVPSNKAIFLFAKYNNKFIATQVALIYKDTIYAWYTGAIKEYLSYHPGDLLIWHLLEWGSENGYKTFDFGGGGSPTKNVNIRNYKARFGCEFYNYGRYKKVHSQIKMKIAEKGFKLYRKYLSSVEYSKK